MAGAFKQRAIGIPSEGTPHELASSIASIRDALLAQDERRGEHTVTIAFASDMSTLAEFPIFCAKRDAVLLAATFTPDQALGSEKLTMTLTRRTRTASGGVATVLAKLTAGAAQLTDWAAFVEKTIPVATTSRLMRTGEILTLTTAQAGGFGGPFLGVLTLQLQEAA